MKHTPLHRSARNFSNAKAFSRKRQAPINGDEILVPHFAVRGPKMKKEASCHHVSIAVPSTHRRFWKRIRKSQREHYGFEVTDERPFSVDQDDPDDVNPPTEELHNETDAQLCDSFGVDLPSKPVEVWCLDGASCRLYVGHPGALPKELTTASVSPEAVSATPVSNRSSGYRLSHGCCEPNSGADQKAAPDWILAEGDFVMVVAVPGCVPFSAVLHEAVGVEEESSVGIEFVLLIPRGQLSCKSERSLGSGCATISPSNTPTLSAKAPIQTAFYGGCMNSLFERARLRELRSGQVARDTHASTSEVKSAADMPFVKGSYFPNACHCLYSALLKFQNSAAAKRFLRQMHGLSLPLRRPFSEWRARQHVYSAGELCSGYQDAFGSCHPSCPGSVAYSCKTDTLLMQDELHPGISKVFSQNSSRSWCTPWSRVVCYALFVKSCTFIIQETAARHGAVTTRFALNSRGPELRLHPSVEGFTERSAFFVSLVS